MRSKLTVIVNTSWRLFTDAVVSALNEEREHIVFMLWGRIAQRKERFIRTDNGRHMVLKAVHPSPAVRRKGEWNGKNISRAAISI